MPADRDAAVNRPPGPGGVPSLSELKQLGKYQIERKIGAGGMGTVFLARDTELKRTVALKVLPQDKAANPTLVRRFRAEAQAAAQLRHPNIVAVFDSGEADGYLYIAMEYVEGRDLFEMVSLRGVVPIRRSIDIIKQVAAALQHAYEQNIVHRDIKPSNLLIRRDGVVKLTDLGLARSVDDTLETNITRAGTTVGTVDYMSPEQARNSKFADIRSDLYSLGCTWYQMLTGSPPYPEGAVTNKLQAHAVKPIPDPRDKNPRIPEGLTAVISRMMAKKPEDRYQTPAELLDELNHAQLTDAAISREIFSDDDDGPAAPGSSDEELSGDSYFDFVPPSRPDQETPDQVVTRTRSRGPAPAEPESPAPRRVTSKARPTEPESPEEPARTTSRTRSPAAKGEPEAPAESRKGRPRDARPAAEPDEETPKHRPRTAPDSSGPTPRVDQRGATDSRPMPKPPGGKPLPPKRQPLPDESEGAAPLLSKESLRNLCLVGGFVLVIVGIGWLISSYSNNVPEIGPPPESLVDAGTNPAPVPVAHAEANPSEPPSVVATAPAAVPGRADVAGSPFDVDRVPDWAQGAAPVTGLPTLNVGPGNRSASNFPTIEAALKGVTGDGAVIKLQGPGPFPLPLVELPRARRVVLMAETATDRPVVALIPAEGQESAGLVMQEGILELRGLHFAIDRQSLAGAVNAVQVIDGQLLVQQCSFTATGDASAPATALAVHSTADSTTNSKLESRLLVDQVFIRGAGLVGVAIRRANVDAVIRDSLVLSGTAPAVELTGFVAAGVTDVVSTKPRRILRLLRCTLASQGRSIEASVEPSNPAPTTALVVRDSLLTALGTGSTAVLGATRWPQTRSATESWLTRMSWTSANSLYLGFAELIDLGSSYKVVDAPAWQRVWNVKTDPRQFQKLAFPDSVLEDLSTVLPQDFDSRSLSYRDVKASGGGLPGCSVAKLLIPDVSSHQRAVAVSARPVLPAAIVKPPEPVQVRKVDLKKDDLGVVLNRPDWPGGTLFEATGSGIHTMTPARLESKSARIIFRQGDGPPLRIQHNGKTASSALISVTNGSLELTNGTFEHITGAKATDWLVQSADSTLVLNGCRFQGVEQDAGKPAGLVTWTTPAARRDGDVTLVIRESFLAGAGTGLHLECGRGTIILRNSIIAIRGNAIDLHPLRSETPSVFDADQVTLSATQSAIRISAPPGDAPGPTPVRMFVERTAIAPPLSFRTGDHSLATVLECVGPVTLPQVVDWWGASNGVARQVPHMVRTAGDTGSPADARTGLSAWKGIWGKGHDIRLLTGDKGVYLAGELPIRWRDLKPSTFALHANSQASTWAEGGRAIGANAQTVEEASLARKAEAPKVTPAVNSKKNVGF